MNVFKQRLLNVARSLRESAAPRKFTMMGYGHCGTPQCALGHYAYRRDLQDVFSLGRAEQGEDDPALVGGRYVIQNGVSCSSQAIREHFHLSQPQASELFSGSGCKRASTPIEAALYIEAFAERRWPEPVKAPDWNALASEPLPVVERASVKV